MLRIEEVPALLAQGILAIKEGDTAIGACLKTGVEFSPQIRTGHSLLVRRYDHWWKCPMCFQPFASQGFPDVICMECWYEGSSEKPLIDLGYRKRLKGRCSRSARRYY